MTIVPLTITAANALVTSLHRHHKKTVGALFALGLTDGGKLVGAAIIGRPVARASQDGYTAEITRLVTDGSRNACSKLLAAARKAAAALGYKRLQTYTLETEGGASLRAAGWSVESVVRGRSWSCASRPRIDKHPTCTKLRWIAP